MVHNSESLMKHTPHIYRHILFVFASKTQETINLDISNICEQQKTNYFVVSQILKCCYMSHTKQAKNKKTNSLKVPFKVLVMRVSHIYLKNKTKFFENFR